MTLKKKLLSNEINPWKYGNPVSWVWMTREKFAIKQVSKEVCLALDLH